jgi:conjugative relaxase-like TrwC/TraI family protein
VLCIAKVRAGGHGYYLDVVDSGAEAPGEWLSAGAARLGLHGVVEREDLATVLLGADPASGAALGGAWSRVSVAGFDLTFCAPKSVSVLHALGEPEVSAEVRSGHTEAVRRALSYVEVHALAVRRGSGPARMPQPVEGVPGAGFVHRVSRALDPHLHSHVVVANLGMAGDGTWSALDGRGVYAHGPAAGAVYHAQLRHELTRRLGVEWGPLDRGRADISGIGPEVRRAFSRRTLEIEANILELSRSKASSLEDPAGTPPANRPSTRARGMAALVTRADRDVNVLPEHLLPEWRGRALSAGLTPQRVESVLGRVPSHALDHDPTTDGEIGELVERSLTELGRPVARRDVVRTLCSTLPRGAPAQSIERSSNSLISELGRARSDELSTYRPGVGEQRIAVGGLRISRTPELDDRHRRPVDRTERGAAEAERRRVDRILEELGISGTEDRYPRHELSPDLGLSL